MTEAQETVRPRDMTHRDVPAVAVLHREVFPEYFLTGLGDGVLRRFYAQAVDDPQSAAGVLEDIASGRIIGLGVGTLNVGFHTRLMRRHLLAFAWGIFRGLFVSPVIRKGVWQRLGFIKKFFKPQGDQGLAEAGIPPAPGPEARLLVLAVHPDSRGGRGPEQFLLYVTDQIRGLGAARFGGSMWPDNLSAMILYKRLGWNVKKTGPRRVDTWVDLPAAG